LIRDGDIQKGIVIEIACDCASRAEPGGEKYRVRERAVAVAQEDPDFAVYRDLAGWIPKVDDRQVVRIIAVELSGDDETPAVADGEVLRRLRAAGAVRVGDLAQYRILERAVAVAQQD